MYNAYTWEEYVYLNPDWSYFGKVHEWKNYISDDVANMWHSFTNEQKIAIGEQAQAQADKEEWD